MRNSTGLYGEYLATANFSSLIFMTHDTSRAGFNKHLGRHIFDMLRSLQGFPDELLEAPQLLHVNKVKN